LAYPKPLAWLVGKSSRFAYFLFLFSLFLVDFIIELENWLPFAACREY